jgi:hypothetical protein
MKRKLTYAVGALLVSVAGLLFSAQWWVAKQCAPAAIIKKLEAAHHCSVAVDRTHVALWGAPAVVELYGLRMVPKGENPLVVNETLVAADSVRMTANLWKLFLGDLDVQTLELNRLDVRGARSKKGEQTLRLMLAKPESAPAAAKSDPPEAKTETPFSWRDLPLAANLKALRLMNASYAMRNDKRRTFTEVRDFSAELTNLSFSLKDPSQATPVNIVAGARFVVDNQRLSVRTVDLTVTLNGVVQLFDPATGALNQNLVCDLVLKKGSTINRIPTLARLTENLSKLEGQIGLKLDLPPEGTLLRDTVLKAKFADGTLRAADAVLFPFDSYRIKLERESWASFDDDAHRYEGRLMANDEISRSAVAGIKKYVSAKSPRLAEIVEETVLDKILTEKGNIAIPFISTGEVGHPDVAFTPEFQGALSGAVSKAGAEVIKDTLEGGDAIKGLIDALGR